MCCAGSWWWRMWSCVMYEDTFDLWACVGPLSLSLSPQVQILFCTTRGSSAGFTRQARGRLRPTTTLRSSGTSAHSSVSLCERERERMYACLITGASWYKWSHGFTHICVYSGACYLEWTEQTMLTFTHFVEHFPNLKRQFTLKHAYFSSHLYCYSSILFVLVWAAKFWR